MKNWLKWACVLGVVFTGEIRAVSAADAPPPAAATPAQPAHPLQRIVIVDSPEAVTEPVPAEGDFLVLTGQFKTLNAAELTPRLIEAKGRNVDGPLLNAIMQVVTSYMRQHDYPVADTTVPDQNIHDGVLRVLVRVGTVRNIRTEGAHRFSEAMLQQRLGIASGDRVVMSELDRAVAWANNTNPFRQLKLHLDPVPNTTQYDLTVGVEEEMPLRFAVAYDNTGNELLGYNRYTGAITYGNLWGRDHQFSYQYTTSDHPEIFGAHSVNYQAPLSWRRHVVQFSGAYVKASPTFLEGYFKQHGESIVADAKYIVPYKLQRWQGEISASAGFRETNNNLEFSGTPFVAAVTDSVIATLGAAAVREDPRGKWISALILTGSPGKFNSRSGTRIYQENRLGSNPMFADARLILQRTTFLTPSTASSLRLSGQIASTNLLPSEQFSIGGFGTVRGYKERIIAGDHGYTATHELQQRLPSIALNKHWPKLELVGVAFWDYGRAVVKKPLPGQNRSDHLAGAGLGLRAQVGRYFSASIDAARQLEEVEIPGESHHYVNVKVSLSY